jgi:hypothetical protein
MAGITGRYRKDNKAIIKNQSKLFRRNTAEIPRIAMISYLFSIFLTPTHHHPTILVLVS